MGDLGVSQIGVQRSDYSNEMGSMNPALLCLVCMQLHIYLCVFVFVRVCASEVMYKGQWSFCVFFPKKTHRHLIGLKNFCVPMNASAFSCSISRLQPTCALEELKVWCRYTWDTHLSGWGDTGKLELKFTIQAQARWQHSNVRLTEHSIAFAFASPSACKIFLLSLLMVGSTSAQMLLLREDFPEHSIAVWGCAVWDHKTIMRGAKVRLVLCSSRISQEKCSEKPAETLDIVSKLVPPPPPHIVCFYLHSMCHCYRKLCISHTWNYIICLLITCVLPPEYKPQRNKDRICLVPYCLCLTPSRCQEIFSNEHILFILGRCPYLLVYLLF